MTQWKVKTTLFWFVCLSVAHLQPIVWGLKSQPSRPIAWLVGFPGWNRCDANIESFAAGWAWPWVNVVYRLGGSNFREQVFCWSTYCTPLTPANPEIRFQSICQILRENPWETRGYDVRWGSVALPEISQGIGFPWSLVIFVEAA